MKSRSILSIAGLFFALFLLPVYVNAAEGTLTVAVAANALRPVEETAKAYTESSGVKVRIVHGSTGKLYAQITQGAPFDIFLSADKLRPRLLIEKGLAKEDSGFTYARGSLVLWTGRGDINLAELGLEVLYDERVKKIAIANPVTAPYGRAALDVVIGGYKPKHGGNRTSIEKKIVYGESVSQAFSYARTGNTELALTALATIYGQSGEYLEIDRELYELIVQDGVILKDAADGAEAFKEFLLGKEALEIFTKYGYVARGIKDE